MTDKTKMPTAIKQFISVKADNLSLRRKAAMTAVIAVFLFVLPLTGVFLYTRGRASAATSSSLNFQGRLLDNTGQVVADGSYNIQFNLYSVASGGTTQWTENYLNNASQGVTVKNGYFSVQLGSLTSFPGTINWDQEQWLGMTVRGTASCAFGSCTPADAEMTPRFKLTAVPYAFRAAKLMDTSGNAFSADDLIQKSPSTPQVISSALAAIRLNQTSSGGLLQLQNNGTDVFTVDNTGTATISGGANILGATTNINNNSNFATNINTGTSTGAVTIGSSNAGAITLQSSTSIDIGSNASAQTLTLGNQTGTTAVTVQSGTGGVAIKSASNITLGTVDSTGTLLVLDTKNTSGDPTGVDGAIYYNSVMARFRCYQNGSWADCIGGGSNTSATYTAGLANVGANVTGAAVETLIFTSATAVSNTAGVTGFTAPANGSFTSCLIKNNANITAGILNLRWRVNGVSVGSAACTMNNVTNRQKAEAIGPGVVNFNAGDTIGIAFDTVGLAPITNDFTVFWSVEYSTGTVSGVPTLQASYNASSAPATILTADNKNVVFSLTDTTTDSNFLVNIATGSTGKFAVQNNGTDVLAADASNVTISVNTTLSGTLSGLTGLTVASGGASISGGLDNNSGNITNAGTITGVGTNITANAGLTIASGGTGDLVLDSASNKVVIGATDTTLQRTASGTFSLDLNDGANTTFAILNSGSGVANLDVDGAITAGNGNALTVNVDGDITSNFSALDGSTTTNGTSGAGTSTSLVVTSAANFDVGNYVQISDTNCGGTGVNVCYAKITAKAANTLTITPALRWTTGKNVVEYHVPELGGTNLSSTLANRYGRGYFIAGVATGNGTTYYNEDSIETSLSTFDLLNANVTTLNIGGAASTITIGNATTSINIQGPLSSSGPISTGGTTRLTDTGQLQNITDITAVGSVSINASGSATTTIGNAGATLTLTGNSSSTISLNGVTIDDGELARLDAKDAALVDTNDAVVTAITGTGALTTGSIGSGFGNINIGTNTFTGNGSGLTNLSGTSITTGTVANSYLAGSGALTITAGTGLTGGGSVALGGSTTLNVAYGSASGTAVQGDTTLTCASGSGNLTGGGNTITLGSGGTCNAISTNNAVSFSTSVTTPILTSSGALTISSGGSSALTLDSASNTIVIASTDTSLQRTAAGSFGIDLSDTGTTTFIVTNSAAGVANLNLAEGDLQTGGTTRLTNGGALQNINGLTIASGGANITGNTTFINDAAVNGNTTLGDASTDRVTINGQLLGTNALVFQGSTDDAFATTFAVTNPTANNTITIPNASGTLTLIAPASAQVDSSTNNSLFINKTGASGNILTLQKNGTGVFTIGNNGAVTISTTSTTALDIKNASGTSYFTIDTNNGLVQVGNAVADGTAVVLINDTKNTTGDPTGSSAVNGAQYYNSFYNKFRCYEAGVWKDCIGVTVRSFIDTTADAIVDNNTTNYWDIAAENNNSTPNITLSQASGKAVMGIVTMEVTASSNNDLEVSGRVERGIGAVPTCNAGTQVGAQPGVFASNNGGQKASTITFIDTPNTTQPVYYVLCSDTATVNTAGTVTRIRITLQEVTNNN